MLNKTANTQPQALSTSSLSGTNVVNYHGDHIGEIKDFVVDLESGRITYAVLSFGGFLGMGDKYFALPWASLEIDTEQEVFRLDIAKEQLEEAPGFDKDNWPSTADLQFTDRVYEYYGYEPYSTWRSRTSDTYRVRQQAAKRGTMMDVVDPDRNGV
jgi:sporulation protein YlmC with PRC-barrel domain